MWREKERGEGDGEGGDREGESAEGGGGGRGRGRELLLWQKQGDVGLCAIQAQVNPLHRFSELLSLTISGQLIANIPSSSDI